MKNAGGKSGTDLIPDPKEYRVTVIEGTEGSTLTLRPCAICPGNARISLNYWKAHQRRHRLGDVLECSKCLKIKIRTLHFPINVSYKSPICHQCRPKKGQHLGKGRPGVPEKVSIKNGLGGPHKR